MRGRSPKPTQLRAIEGNRGKRRLETQEPDPPVIVAHDAPEHLDAYGRDFWERMIVDLGRFVGITALDLPKLEIICMTYSRFRMAEASLWVTEKDPVSNQTRTIFSTTYTTHGRNGKQVKTRPEYHQMLEEARLFHSLTAEFGMSPAARARLKGFGQPGMFDNDPLDALDRKHGAPQALTR